MREENFPEEDAVAKWERDFADTSIKRVEQSGETKLAVMGHLKYVFEQGASRSSSLVTKETAADDADAARLSKKARRQYSAGDQVLKSAGGGYFQEGSSSRVVADEGAAMGADLFGMGGDASMQLDAFLGEAGGNSLAGGGAAQAAACSKHFSPAKSVHSSEKGDGGVASPVLEPRGMSKRRRNPSRASGPTWRVAPIAGEFGSPFAHKWTRFCSFGERAFLLLSGTFLPEGCHRGGVALWRACFARTLAVRAPHLAASGVGKSLKVSAVHQQNSLRGILCAPGSGASDMAPNAIAAKANEPGLPPTRNARQGFRVLCFSGCARHPR